MPSWTSRLLPASQASSAPRSPLSDHSGPAKHEYHEQLPHLVPSPQVSGPHHTPSRSSSHGRSLSHPLTSLLGQGKKVDHRYRNGSTSVNTGAQNDSLDYSQPNMNRGYQSDNPKHTPTAKAQDLELISGRCATCDSLITWPKHLKVFRCTICLMVNDLQPPEKGPPDGLHPQKYDKRKSVKVCWHQMLTISCSKQAFFKYD